MKIQITEKIRKKKNRLKLNLPKCIPHIPAKGTPPFPIVKSQNNIHYSATANDICPKTGGRAACAQRGGLVSQQLLYKPPPQQVNCECDWAAPPRRGGCLLSQHLLRALGQGDRNRADITLSEMMERVCFPFPSQSTNTPVKALN